jgi:hypothetical protein
MKRQLFTGIEIVDFLENQRRQLWEEVDGFSEEYLLGTQEADLIEYLTKKYSPEAPIVGEPYIEGDREIKVDVSDDPRRFVFDRSKPCYIPGNRIEIRLPFSGGGPGYFNIAPSHRDWSPPVADDVCTDYLSFIFEGAGLQPADIQASISKRVKEIRSHLTTLQSDFDQFNARLGVMVSTRLKDRRDRHTANQRLVQGIGLPIKRRENAPLTYAVPDVRRKPDIRRPQPIATPQPAEPILQEAEYEHILSIIRGMVSVMERSPNAFKHLGEEDLRWHFLVQLNGQYEGRGTGEAFNYQGKTDILIREGDRNVFIAECKIWKGEAELVKAIDQILGYLHWRDTKAALLVFNRNKAFSDVLAKIPVAVERHPNCKKLINRISETEWRFLFSNKDDANRELQIAVLLFDVPRA